jgi:hypothetical protein
MVMPGAFPVFGVRQIDSALSVRHVTPLTSVTVLLHSDRGALRMKRFTQTVWTAPSPTLLHVCSEYEGDERAGQHQRFCKLGHLTPLARSHEGPTGCPFDDPSRQPDLPQK